MIIDVALGLLPPPIPLPGQRYDRGAVRETIYTPELIFDGACGTGAWGRAARARWPLTTLIGLDRRDQLDPHDTTYDQTVTADYLAWENPYPAFNLIIGTPPSSIAEAWVRYARQMLHHEHGRMLVLLPIALLEGAERGVGLWKEYPPHTVWVCARRPPHRKVAYAFYYWQHGVPYFGTRLGWVTWQDTEPTTHQRRPKRAGISAGIRTTAGIAE